MAESVAAIRAIILFHQCNVRNKNYNMSTKWNDFLQKILVLHSNVREIIRISGLS